MSTQARAADGKFLKTRKFLKRPTARKKVSRKVKKSLKIKRGKTPGVLFGKNYITNQIYSMGYEFAFMGPAKRGYQQACTFVYCKDFLHDAVWAFVNKTKWAIYSFHYDVAKDKPLATKNCVFAFRNTAFKGKEKAFHAKREACQEFLNKAEKKMGLQPSQIYEVPHDNGPCWLVVGDKGWQHAPPMVGLYTLFIRVGVAHTLGASLDTTLEKAKAGKIKIGDGGGYAGSNDCTYIKQSWKGIQVILKHGLKVFHDKMADNYPKNLPQKSDSLHDDFGPVSFTEQLPKQAMPHWYRSSIWK